MSAEISDSDDIDSLVDDAMDDRLTETSMVSDVDAASQPLRLLFAVDSRFPGAGGAEKQALKLANALRERGVEVDFVAPYLNTESPLVEYIDGFTITKIDYPKIKLLGSVFLAAKFAHYIYKNQHNYDCVHIHITRILAASAGLIRPFIDCILVTKISGFFEFEGGILDEKKRFNPANMLIRFALRKIDYVQTISVETREKLERAGFRPEQIKFIPNGIELPEELAEKRGSSDTHTMLADIDYSPVQKFPDTFVLGFCGRMREVKGIHILIDGFAQLVKRNPDAKLLLRIAGDGDCATDLENQVETLGITDQVDFVGFLDQTAPFISSLDLYVQPSFAEGLPNSVIEAMNASLPIVATNIGGNNELVFPDKNGLLFEAGETSELAEKLQWCLDNQSRLDEMGIQSKNIIVENYGFAYVTGELISLYKQSS